MVTTFEGLWPTLGLAGNTAVDQTIRPRTIVGHTSIGEVPRAEALAPSTLPHLSIGGIQKDEAGALGGARRAGPEDIFVTDILGEGGMGRVLLGYQHSLRREVAIKTVLEGGPAAAAAAILSEGFITGHLEHPNIIPVHALGRGRDGSPLLVMKRILGVEWATLLADPADPAWKRIPTLGPDPLLAHVEVLMQVCKALAYAHGRGVLHRDVKPQNVMIGELGEVYLVDWGVATTLDAQETRKGIVGTPCFSAPEMIDDALPLGAWTDVYLLGATLHFVLTGRPRHEGTLLRQVVMSAYESRPVAYPASVPAELADLCNRATARDPAKRPASAMAFHRDLAAYVAHTGSLSLAGAADERFVELERLLGAPQPDLTRASRVAAECRFVHLLALRDWPQNPRAKAGLQRCLERMVEMEVARENAGAARAILIEMFESDVTSPGGPVDRAAVDGDRDVASRLEAMVVELEARHADRLRKEEELHKLRHDGDLSVASRQRTIFLFGMMGVIGLGTVSLLRPGTAFADQIPTAPALFQIAVGAFVLAALGVALGRKHLLRNAINRAFVGVFLGALLLMAIHRGLAVVAGMEVRDTLRTDLLITATAVWSTAVLVRRVWMVGALVMVAGAIASTFVPTATAALFPICTFVLLGIIGLGWRTPSPTGAPPPA